MPSSPWKKTFRQRARVLARCVRVCVLMACVHRFDAAAQSLEAVPPPTQRPKIGLVLSGGGARGVAHVGVLKVLDEMRIPVDFVVGTSMGSIVGGAYAGGMTPREMEERIRAVHWDQVLSDQPPRGNRSVRSKQLDQLNVYGLEIGVRDGKLTFPAGAIIGQQLEFFLGSLAQGAANVTSFDQLPIPYRAIATDVEDGSMVVLDHGSLSEAMRASMSVPGLFAPRQIDGRDLVDGGLSRNLPVDVARALGADVIIAVNVGTPLQRKNELGTLFGVTAQVIVLLTAQNVRQSLSELRADDVLIVPELGTFSSLDFPRCVDTIAIGERAARGMQERLAGLALPEAEYAHFRGAQLLKAQHRLEVQEIQVDTSGLKRVNPESVKAQIKSRTGERFDPDAVDDDIRALYATDDFQQVRYRFEDQDGRRVLVIEPVEKSWGPNYLRFGLDMSTDLEGESAFTLGIDHRATWLNRRGLEWRNTVFLGQHTGWISELYQPVDLARTWFVAPAIAFHQQSYNLYLDDRAIAQYLIRNSEAALQVGRRFGSVGEVRAGYAYSAVHAYPSTAVPGFTDVSVHQGGLTLSLVLDQYDHWAFPGSGYTLSAQYWSYHDGLGADLDYDKALLEFGYALGHGRHSLTIGGKYGTSLGTTLPDYDGFELGGPLNLSGFQENQLVGTGVKLGRLVYYYRLADGGRFVKAYYVGGSLEAGNVTDRQNGPPRSGLIFGSSAFVGADTVLGPLYFALGYAEGGNYAIYLFLGRR